MNMLFECSSYREFLKKMLAGPMARRGVQSEWASAMGCQAAYLSQVLKEKAELTEDQACRLALHLNLTSVATEFFLLLVRLSRATTLELRDFLLKEIEGRREESKETRSRIRHQKTQFSDAQIQTYFSSWIPSTIHVATSCPEYQTVPSLAQRFGLKEKQVQEVLNLLAEMAIVKRDKDKWSPAGGPLHFPRSQSINVQHQVTRRLQAIRSIEGKQNDDLHFSSVFTVNQQTFAKLKSELLEYVERSHLEIHQSPSDEVCAICLDLFTVV